MSPNCNGSAAIVPCSPAGPRPSSTNDKRTYRGCGFDDIQSQRIRVLPRRCARRESPQRDCGMYRDSARLPVHAAPRSRGRFRRRFPHACKNRDREVPVPQVDRGPCDTRQIATIVATRLFPVQAQPRQVFVDRRSNSGFARARSMSSMRSRKRPPCAASCAVSAAKAWPRCR
jgi:hypothetical protein